MGSNIGSKEPPANSPSVPQRLMQHIRDEGYKMGDRLPSIRQLAEMMDASPNVIRDGLLEAQTKGMIRIVPRSGAYVQSLDLSALVDGLDESLETALAQQDPNLFQLIEARCTIEMKTVSIAALRRRPEDLARLRDACEDFKKFRNDRDQRIEADERLHLIIAETAGNNVLVTILQALLTLMRPYRISVQFLTADLERSQKEHELILRAIAQGNSEEARSLIERHINTHLQTLSQV